MGFNSGFKGLMQLDLSRKILEKNAEILNFMKIPSVGVELFYADGQTDMTKLTVPFRNFTKAT